MWTIDQLRNCKGSEHKVEFKRAEKGSIPYDGSSYPKPSARRRCILGYITALCNERGGSLVLGMSDEYPHQVIGTTQHLGRIGQLEADIYRDTQIRVHIYELYDEEKRVLVIDVPSRPIGHIYKYEDVALMRVGEELRPMSDEVYLSIIQEKEPDFSEQICRDATLEDLDTEAISILKKRYALKQHNESFRALTDKQALSDLKLINSEGITNAAIILLGTEEAIRRLCPQSAIILEYRQHLSQTSFDKRWEYRGAYLRDIDKIWTQIDHYNRSITIRDGAYNLDIRAFNEEVVREALNNAVAHRDYLTQSETFVKVFPTQMDVINGGGFPRGVSIENLLLVPSTPRNRLLADILAKVGLVERSGQGIDRIFLHTLSEGKPAPDYSSSDSFYVALRLSAEIADPAFAKFIDSIQSDLSEDDKLSVIDVVTLHAVLLERTSSVDKADLQRLAQRGYLEKKGQSRARTYILSRDYYEMAGKLAEYSKKSDWTSEQVLMMLDSFFRQHDRGSTKDLVELFQGHLTRRQVRYNIERFSREGLLCSSGKGPATTYSPTEEFLRRRRKQELVASLVDAFDDIPYKPEDSNGQ